MMKRSTYRGRAAREGIGVRAAVAGMLIVWCVALTGCREGEAEFVPPPPPQVTVDTAKLEQVTVYEEFPGRIDAVDSVQIPARVSGFVREILFRDGRFVDEGEVLFRIEPEEYEAVVAQAKASVASAQASLNLAETRLDRAEEAMAQGAVSEFEMLEYEAERDLARAQLESAKAQLERAELDLSYTEVFAPFRGRMSERRVSVGDYVQAGGGSVMAELTEVDPLFVYFNASERAVLKFQGQGQAVSQRESEYELPEDQRIPIRLRLSDGTVYDGDGYVDFASPEIDRTTGTLLLRGRVQNPDLQLFPGQFARVMVVDYEGEALLVPELAVQRDLVGPYLLVVGDGNVVERREVELGSLLGDRRIITDGVTEEDWIVVVGMQRARPGLPVDPQSSSRGLPGRGGGGGG